MQHIHHMYLTNGLEPDKQSVTLLLDAHIVKKYAKETYTTSFGFARLSRKDKHNQHLPRDNIVSFGVVLQCNDEAQKALAI